jgi:hypothetical protein
MATNTKRGRKGQIRNRAQVKNPITKKWVKIDTTTGRIIDHKKTPGPFKGVRKAS